MNPRAESGTPRTTGERARHWDAAYTRRGAAGVSWYQAEASISLDLIDALGVRRDAAVVDVGGGASVFAERLVARGFSDVSVLDLSSEALAEGRRHAGEGAPIHWLVEDVLVWRPERRFDVWHDRAVFHFLVDPADRETYLETLRFALQADGVVVLGTFAEDGPERCSGLPVARYSVAELAELLGAEFELVATRREEHVTPGGVTQAFAWVAGRRLGPG